MIFKKLLGLFEIGALLLAIGAASLANTVAAGDAAKHSQNRPVAQALPPAGIYKVDPDHTFAYFGARHHVVGLVRGRFDKVTGTLNVSPDPAACSVDIAVDVSSISTQVTERDQDLLSDAYFDVKRFPTMTYQGRGIRRASDGSWTMDGSLTLHGVTKVVPLTFNFNGPFSDVKPSRPARMAFHGTAAVKRVDFGMGARDNPGELGVLTTPDVDIEIDVEADAKAPTQ